MGAVAGMLVWSAAAHAAPADRAAAVALVAAQRQDEAVASGWTGNAASCTVGTESQASLDATLRSVNRFRAMTGLGPVAFDPALNARALAAALMMHAKDHLEHQPGRDWPCYTDAGADGAAHSNLFLSSGDATGARAVAEFMTDIGHGRWVTNPGATTMGSGTAGHANALYVVLPDGREPGATEAHAWPPSGWVPWEWMPTQWRVTIGNDHHEPNFGVASVSATLDGKPLEVHHGPSDTDYAGATGTMYLFRPVLDPDATGDTYRGDHVVRVTIAGATVAGDPVTLRWTVCGFDPDRAGTLGACPVEGDALGSSAAAGGGGGSSATSAPGFARSPALRRLSPRGRKIPVGSRPRTGTRLAVAVTAKGGRVAAYQWLRDGRTIRGATKSTYRVRARDRGHRISVRVTVRSTDGARTARRTSASVRV